MRPKVNITPLSYKRHSWGLLSNPMGWIQLIITNSLIALMLVLVNESSFIINLVFSQVIGFLIVTALTLNVRLRKLEHPDWKAYITSIPIAAFIGIIISLVLTGEYKSFSAFQGGEILLRGVLFSVVAGGAVAWYFHLRGKHLLEWTLLAEQLALNAERERQLSEARFEALQAQIEPHFLFNTLSNVVGLIDSDKEAAKRMLESLTDFLRSTLQTTRRDTNTVRDEMELLETYLSILKIRMGDRLSYRFSVDEPCETLNLTPLLLQPLVENAVKHGLEPQLEGGQIDITVADDKGYLVCKVEDDGCGLQPEADMFLTGSGNGMGLENIKKRLLSLYGENARLSIKGNSQGGVTALIRIPLDALLHEKNAPEIKA